MAPADLFPYQEHRERFKKNTIKKGFVEAVWEIEEDPSLKISSSVTVLPNKGRGKKRLRPPEQEVRGQVSWCLQEEWSLKFL